MKVHAWNLCKEFLAGPWKDVTLDEFRFSEVRGGLSNTLYLCSLPENVASEDPKMPKEVLLRVYGPLQEEVDLVLRDVVTFMLLSERKLGPKLYGVFPKGRLEEFIPSHSLSSAEMRKYSTSIAREMAKIHALNIPVRKVPEIFFEGHTKKWLKEAKEAIDEDNGKYFIPVPEYENEMKWLLAEMKKTNSPVVYCHNDLQGGNVLYREDSTMNGRPNLTLIDFEFGGYNYRGFDIANHLVEWCFDYDTPDFPHFVFDLKKFPSKQEQLEFCGSYLDQLSKEGVHTKKSREEEAEKIVQDMNIFVCACHLMWILWSVKMTLPKTETFGHQMCDQNSCLENENGKTGSTSNDDRNWKEKMGSTLMAAFKEHAKTRKDLFYTFKELVLKSESESKSQ